ncbi:MAG: molybdate ABC transporter substrate-binding protein [Sciscionella sp.]
MKKLLSVGAVLATAALVAGCGSSGQGSGSGDQGSGDQGSGDQAGDRTLNVFAAASLTESFQALGTEFEAAHKGVTVNVNFGGSSSLVQQIDQGGAPADVFASANQKNMDKLVQAGNNAGDPRLFARNTLEIAVPAGNPKKIKSFADLARSGVKVVVCAPQVPCGSATEKVEKATGTTLKPRSEETNVKQVLTKVQANEADAGLVYVTDVNSAGDKVAGITFPEASKAINNYPIVAVKGSKHAELAKEFIEFVRGAQGRAELEKVGFQAP